MKNEKIDGDLAELIGIHIGDGCISVNSRYSEYYLGGDLNEEKEYHDNWVGPLFNKKIMNPLFGKDVIYKEHPKVGVYGFYIFNKELVDFFKKLGIVSGSKINMGIPKKILLDKYLLKRFLRGLFDTDGSIYFDKNHSAKVPINNYPRIKLDTVSKVLIRDTFNSFKKMGLHPRIRKPYRGKRNKNTVYSVVLYRKSDISFFINEIEFKNPKHYTKWQVFMNLGYCPSYTTLVERRQIIGNSKNL
jgi:intein/homing endonuclease|tara:strand:- start:156 stop:890 length:735 start_codon:yes stop_codon:yes gene_type:complete